MSFSQPEKLKKELHLGKLVNLDVCLENANKLLPHRLDAPFIEICKSISTKDTISQLMSREYDMSVESFNAYNAFITDDKFDLGSRLLVALHFFSLNKGNFIIKNKLSKEIIDKRHELTQIKSLHEKESFELTTLKQELSDTRLKLENSYNYLIDRLEQQSKQLEAEFGKERQHLQDEINRCKLRLSIYMQPIDYNLPLCTYVSVKGDIDYLRHELEEIRSTMTDLRRQKYEFERIRQGIKNIAQIASSTQHKVNIALKNKQHAKLILQRSKNMTDFSKFLQNNRLNENFLSKFDKQDIESLKNCDYYVIDKENNEGFLRIFHKLAVKTNVRTIKWYRHYLVENYWGFKGNSKELENKNVKFYLTYIDPLNQKPRSDFENFLAMTSRKRRKIYYKFYKAFDKETGNRISIYKSDYSSTNIPIESCQTVLNSTKNMTVEPIKEKESQPDYAHLYN